MYTYTHTCTCICPHTHTHKHTGCLSIYLACGYFTSVKMSISHSSTLHTLYTITSALIRLRNNDCSSYTYTYANIHAYSPMHTHSLTHTYTLNTQTFTHTNLASYFSLHTAHLPYLTHSPQTPHPTPNTLHTFP